MVGGRCFAFLLVGGLFLFLRMVGGRCLNQYMVGGRWLMVGGLWSVVGGFVLRRSQLQSEEEFTNQRSSHFKLCLAVNFKSLWKKICPKLSLAVWHSYD